MRRAVLTKWLDPKGFEIEEIEKPTPGDGEILIKVISSSVTAGDCEIRRLKLPLSLSLPIRLYGGWRKPDKLKVLGQEYSGAVEAIGKDVTNFKVRDEVFGTTGMGFGAYSQYIVRPSKPKDTQGVIAPKPKNLTFNEASVIPTAGMEALHYINSSGVNSGDKLLIVGAGGSIGTLTLQLAKSRGVNVTAIDRTEKIEMLKELGADRVIDYTRESLGDIKEKFDLIIDVVGKGTVIKNLKHLKRGGKYYLAFGQIYHLWLSLFVKIFNRKKLSIAASNQTLDELISLKDTAESGLIKAIIDRTFPLERTSDAHTYSDGGLKKGNIVIELT